MISVILTLDNCQALGILPRLGKIKGLFSEHKEASKIHLGIAGPSAREQKIITFVDS